MVTPTQPRADDQPLGVLRPIEDPVEAAEIMRGFEQYERNRDHFYSRREELFRDHYGKYVIVYADDQILIGDDLLEMFRQFDDGVLAPAFVECLVEPIEFPSIWD